MWFYMDIPLLSYFPPPSSDPTLAASMADLVCPCRSMLPTLYRKPWLTPGLSCLCSTRKVQRFNMRTICRYPTLC